MTEPENQAEAQQGQPVERQSAHEDRIERLNRVFYIRWTSGPNYERAYLCVEDGEPDMNAFAEVSFGLANIFKAGMQALAALPEAPAVPVGVEVLFDFEPQIAFSHFGPERSIRWILEWFYKQNGIDQEKAKAVTQSYAAALAALQSFPPVKAGLAEYKAKNAEHGWSGRGFSFDPGFLNLNKEGDANIGFAESDMQYERDDETGKDYVYCNVPVSEILALRDYLNDAFPPVKTAAVDGIAQAAREAIDLLKETKQGNPARSAGHNARLVLESALASRPAAADAGVREALAEFAREMCRIGFDGADASGGDILEAAEKHGLVRAEVYDPKRHSDIANSEYLDPGDRIYVFTDALSLAAKREPRG